MVNFRRRDKLAFYCSTVRLTQTAKTYVVALIYPKVSKGLIKFQLMEE